MNTKNIIYREYRTSLTYSNCFVGQACYSTQFSIMIGSRPIYVDNVFQNFTITIKHIRAKPSALSQNPSQLLARMRRCVRVILSTHASYSRPRPAPKALGVVASSKVRSELGSTICWIPVLDSGLWTLDSGLFMFPWAFVVRR